MAREKNRWIEMLAVAAAVASAVAAWMGLKQPSSESKTETITVNSSGANAAQIGKIEGNLIVVGEKNDQAEISRNAFNGNFNARREDQKNKSERKIVQFSGSLDNRASDPIPTFLHQESSENGMSHDTRVPIQSEQREDVASFEKIGEKSASSRQESPVSGRSAPVDLGDNLSYFSYRWRLATESCFKARRFDIENDVIEEYFGMRLMYSGRIKIIDGNRVLMQDNSQFIFNGQELHYVEDQAVSVFKRC